MAARYRDQTSAAMAPARNWSGRLQRVHDRLGWMLLVIVAASAIPFGSARPFLWALCAAAIAGAGLYYGIALERSNSPLRQVPIGRVATGAFALMCLWLLIQTLPLPLPWAGAVATGEGTARTLPQISLAPGSTLLMLVQVLSYGLLFLLVLLVGANRYRRLWLLDALYLVIVLHAAYALIALTQLGDIVLIFPKWAYEGVATGTFVNRNAFATYLAMGLVLGVGLTLDEIVHRLSADRLSRAKDGGRPPRSLMLHGVGLLIVIAALLATQSRMGTAAALAGTIVVAIPLVAALPVQPGLRLAIGAAALAAVAALAVRFAPGLFERLGSVETSADVRLELYAQVLKMIMARPWTGYGGAAFDVAFPLFHQLPVSPDLVWDKAHNTYLALWVELGVIVGTIPILLLVGFGFRLFLISLRSSERMAPLIGLGALVAAGVHSFVDFSLEIEANALLLLTLVALGLAAAKPGTPSSSHRSQSGDLRLAAGPEDRASRFRGNDSVTNGAPTEGVK